MFEDVFLNVRFNLSRYTISHLADLHLRTLQIIEILLVLSQFVYFLGDGLCSEANSTFHWKTIFNCKKISTVLRIVTQRGHISFHSKLYRKLSKIKFDWGTDSRHLGAFVSFSKEAIILS